MKNHAQNTIFIQNGTVKLAVTIHSAEKIETVILLHGGPGVPDDMVEVVDQLKKNYKVITFEQRGVGLSSCTKCSFTIKDYILDIDVIITKLAIKSFHLFGHSWGGLYAQIYAEERPEKIKSLFLCSPSSGTNKIWKKTEKEVLEFNKNITSKKEWLSMGWNSLLGVLGNNNAYRKLFLQVFKNYHKGFSESKVETKFIKKIFSKPINKTRKEIIKYKNLSVINTPKYPITITYGSNDIYGESKTEVFKRFPTAVFEIIQNCGHIPWKNNKEAFIHSLNNHYQLKENTLVNNSKRVLIK